MNLNLEPQGEDERSRRQLAAAYSFLSKLSDDAFESLLERETILPPEYEKAVENYSSIPIQERISKWKADGSAVPPISDEPDFAGEIWKVFEQMARQFKGILSEFEIESFASAHLGDHASEAENEVIRVIPLADWPALHQELPWLGGALRVYRQSQYPDAATVKYVAFVETLEVEPTHQDGELRVVLAANNGKRGEVLLSSDFPSCEFPIPLPADESELTLECYADGVA